MSLTSTPHNIRRRNRTNSTGRLIRLVFKEYASIFGLLIGIWLTRHSLRVLTVDLEEKENEYHSPSKILTVHTPPISQTGSKSKSSTVHKLNITIEQEQLREEDNRSVHTLHPNVTYYPPYQELRQMVDGGNVTAGQFLLDFAILGFPKCGTSTMMYWLGDHPEIQAIQKEVTTFQRNHPAQIINQIYKFLEPGPYLRGYKSPNDVENVRAINKLSDHFPTTKLIIGLRHPVLWFESFYNYRIQNGFDLPELTSNNTESQRACMGGMYGVCTDRSRLYTSLVNFGKTPLSSEELSTFFNKRQQKSLTADQQNRNGTRLKNPIFLYDTAQLGDTELTRQVSFRKKLGQYLGIVEELSPPVHASPGKTLTNITEQRLRDKRKIHICDSIHTRRRQILIEGGKLTAKWILEFFLKSPDVHVANSNHFQEIMDSYGKDPCS